MRLPTLHRLVHLRDLLRELVARDMKLRYKRSVLGVAWSLLNPLAHLGVFYFIFGYVLPLNIPNYAMYLLTGVLAWSWFQMSLLAATGALVESRDLVQLPNFPPAVLPVVTVSSHLLHFLLALPIFLGLILTGGGQMSLALLTLPMVIAVQFVVTLGLAYVVASVHVTFRDTQYLLGILLQLMFFLTPVFYEATAIPAQFQRLYRLNPMVPLIEAYRAILIRGELPDVAAMGRLGLGAVLILTIGYGIFVRTRYRFIEEI
jgi:lipopolysaccharide transport system permease protein